MKDLEKIKSEDLGCQVQDANPGNFAIEQEVAAMVGATVPAPTEPSADDARELGAQLLVFLRRALLPIRSALRTALAAIYSHLDSRCTDYTPAVYAPYQPLPSYDPMGTPPTPRTLPNLLTAITAFSPRKISNLGNGIPDGISLAKLLGCSENWNAVTGIEDDSPTPWVMDRSLSFPSATKVSLNCYKMDLALSIASCTDLVLNNLNEFHMHVAYQSQPQITGFKGETMTLPALERLYGNYCIGSIINHCDMRVLRLPAFTTHNPPNNFEALVAFCPNLEEFYAENTDNISIGPYIGLLGQCPKIKKIVIGRTNAASSNYDCIFPSGEGSRYYGTISNADLIDIEIGAGGQVIDRSMSFKMWNPTNVLADADKTATFLQNFKDHIALRLTDQGSGKTLTLSQAVRDAIHAAEATYGIEAIIVTQKGWTLSPAPGASSQ